MLLENVFVIWGMLCWNNPQTVFIKFQVTCRPCLSFTVNTSDISELTLACYSVSGCKYQVTANLYVRTKRTKTFLHWPWCQTSSFFSCCTELTVSQTCPGRGVKNTSGFSSGVKRSWSIFLHILHTSPSLLCFQTSDLCRLQIWNVPHLSKWNGEKRVRAARRSVSSPSQLWVNLLDNVWTSQYDQPECCCRSALHLQTENTGTLQMNFGLSVNMIFVVVALVTRLSRVTQLCYIRKRFFLLKNKSSQKVTSKKMNCKRHGRRVAGGRIHHWCTLA